MNNLIIREMRKDEYKLLKDFLYEAIFIPKGTRKPPRKIINNEEYRSKGIGTKLMKTMLRLLKDKGYKKTSLSVQKNNYAVKMYINVGFKIIDESKEEYVMVCNL